MKSNLSIIVSSTNFVRNKKLITIEEITKAPNFSPRLYRVKAATHNKFINKFEYSHIYSFLCILALFEFEIWKL